MEEGFQMKQKRRILAIALAMVMVLTLLPMTAFAEEGDQQEGFPWQVSFQGERDYGWAYFFSLDDHDDTMTVDDLGIGVYDGNTLIPPAQYQVEVYHTWYDDDQGGDQFEPVGDEFGLSNMDKNNESGFTEYVVQIKQEGAIKGEGHFFLVDSHSLNWICTKVNFKDEKEQGDWRMHERYWFDLGTLTDPDVSTQAGTELTKDVDYSLAYYRRTGNPDADEARGIIKDFEEYLVKSEETKVDGTPIESGGFFVSIAGTGSFDGGGYYGGTEILIDVEQTDRGEGEYPWQVGFQDVRDYDWAYFFTLDDQDAMMTVPDLGIGVYDGELLVPSDQYQLKIYQTWYDDNQGIEIFQPVGDEFGLADRDKNNGSGFTEYVVFVKKDEVTKAEGHFYLMDSHSLNWICADLSFATAQNMDGWRMHERFWFDAGKLTDPVVKTQKGTTLVKDQDYSLTYYRLTGDPDADEAKGIIKGFEEYLVKSDETRINGIPTDSGKYFLSMGGKGDYYGGTEVLVYVAKRDQTIQTAVKDPVAKVYGSKAFSLGAKASGGGKLSYKSSNLKVATVSPSGVVTIKGVGSAVLTILAAENVNYNAAKKTIRLNVSKAANPIIVKAKKPVTAKAGKTTYIKWKKAFAIGKAQGTLSFKRIKGNKLITINKKNGLITVKKGLKPKNYPVKIRVIASGTKNYKAGYKDVTIKVAVR